MRTLAVKISLAFRASLLLLLAGPGLARAADAPGTINPTPPVAVGVIAFRSLDAIAATAGRLGVTLPPFLTARDIGDTFPNIGAAGMATDKPIGVIFLAGQEIQAEQIVVYALPIKSDRGALDAFRDQGAVTLANHPDTVILRGTALRRTPEYLLIGQSAIGIAAINTDCLAAALQSPGAVGDVTIDLKLARQTMPQRYQSLMAAWLQQAIAASAASPALKLFMPRLRETIDGLDRLNIVLQEDAGAMRLGLTLSPFRLPAPPPGNRPGMPAGVFGRVDIALPMTGMTTLNDALINSILQSTDAERPGKPLTDAQKLQIAGVYRNFADLAFGASTTSVGAEMVRGEPVVYLVQRWAKPIDFSARIRRWYMQSAAADPDHQSSAAFFVYEKGPSAMPGTGPLKVLRIVPSNHGKPLYYLDIVQRDDQVFMAACANSYGYVHNLVNAPPESAPFASLISTTIDLGKLAADSANTLGSPLTTLPAEKQKQAIELLKGRTASFATLPQGDAATFQIAIDAGLVQSMPRLLQLLGVVHADATPQAK